MKYLLNDLHIVLFSVFLWSWKMNRISEFRKSINLTQQEFSARLNLTQGRWLIMRMDAERQQ